MTAVMRRAEAVLHAFIMIRSSIRPSFMAPGAVDWMMKTSSSRTDSPIVIEVSWLLNWREEVRARGMPSLYIEVRFN